MVILEIDLLKFTGRERFDSRRMLDGVKRAMAGKGLTTEHC